MRGLLSRKAGQQIARRLGWGVADQGVSSLENFLLGVYVARTMGAAGLGAFAMALVAYAIVLNGSRALSTDPLMVRFSGASNDCWRRAVASSSGVALLAGAAGGVGCMVVGALMLGHLPEAGAALVAMGVVLPGLTLQDSWRYAFFAAGAGSKAFINDVVWSLLLLVTLLVGEFVGLGGVAFAVLAFGATATLAGLFGMLHARTVPKCRYAAGWLREHRDLGPRFLVENVVLGAAGRVRSFVVAGTVSLAAVGAIRGAEMLIGPVSAVLMGVAQVAVPEAARAVNRGGGRLQRLCLGLSGGLAAVAFAWGLVILVVFPFGMGELLLGTVWAEAHGLALGVTISAMAGCLHIGPSAGLRALGRADKTMRCQLAVSALVVTLSCAGAVGWGAVGAVWGTAIASTAGAGIWWRQLANAQREHLAAVTPEASAPTAQRDVQERG